MTIVYEIYVEISEYCVMIVHALGPERPRLMEGLGRTRTVHQEAEYF